MARRAVMITLVSLAFSLALEPATGAVRECADFVENSGGGQTEKEAKANALDGWTKKVEALGMKQVRWQTAADRSLQCRSVNGSYYCAARARPCVIKQVPPKNWHPEVPRDLPKDNRA